MKAQGKRILSAILALCLAAGLLAVMPVITSAVDVDATILETDSVAGIQSVLQGIINGLTAPDTLTVYGSKTDAAEDLVLSIPGGITVLWLAAYEGEPDSDALISLTGGGLFQVGEGGSIVCDGLGLGYWAIYSAAGDVAVDGGTVDVTDGNGIYANGDVTISDASVATSAGKAIAANGDVYVTDSTVTTDDGTAIEATTAVTVSGSEVTGTNLGITAGTVTVSSGTVEATDGTAISAGSATVSGGTVIGTDKGIGSGGAVTVSGGTVKATAASGIGIEAAGKVTLSGATAGVEGNIAIKAGSVEVTAGSVAGGTTGIYSAGDVLIEGGSVTASSATPAYDRAILCVSGKVTVTGGAVSATTAIDIYGSIGAAVYLAGTCTGNFNVASHGVIAEVAIDQEALIPSSHCDTARDLTIKAESYLSAAKWSCSGIVDDPAKIIFTVINPAGTPATRDFDFIWGVSQVSALSAGTVNRTSDTASTIGFTTNVDGKAYVLNLTETAPAPSAATLKATGIPLGDVTIGAVSGKAVALNPGKRIIYVVLEDKLGNFTNVLKIEAPAFSATYTVTVVNGTGGGVFSPGVSIPIVASTAPAGMVFDKWTTSDGVIFVDANAGSTSFTMPGKDVKVTATYKNASSTRYVGFGLIFGMHPPYVSSAWNWFRFIFLFGWIWMWFV